MKYPNAAKGVKRIFTAEILKLLFALLMIAAGFFAVLALGSAQNEAELIGETNFIIAMVCLLAGGVLEVIAFILNLVGISNAAKDEQNFKNALIFVLVGLVLRVASLTVGMLVKEATIAAGVLDSASDLMQLFVYIFIVSGIIRLADRYNRGDISAKGTNVIKIVILINVLAIIASIVVTLMGGTASSVVTAILTIITGVLCIVQYVMYLSLLSQAKKMLFE